MAQVNIEEIVYHLDAQMKRALEAAVKDVLPAAAIDRTALYKAFLKQVRKKCDTWEHVPDQHVRKD